MGSTPSSSRSTYADEAESSTTTTTTKNSNSGNGYDGPTAAPPAKDETATKILFYQDKSKEKELSGMALVNYKCRRRKKKYDKCAGEWYQTQFMTGKSMNQEEVCGDLFESYRTCILKGIKVEVWDKQGLPPPKEGSPLAEIEEDGEDD